MAYHIPRRIAERLCEEIGFRTVGAGERDAGREPERDFGGE